MVFFFNKMRFIVRFEFPFSISYLFARNSRIEKLQTRMMEEKNWNKTQFDDFSQRFFLHFFVIISFFFIWVCKSISNNPKNVTEFFQMWFSVVVVVTYQYIHFWYIVFGMGGRNVWHLYVWQISFICNYCLFCYIYIC